MAEEISHPSRYVKLTREQAPTEDINPGELNLPIDVPQVWRLAPVTWNSLQEEIISFKDWWKEICLMHSRKEAEERIQLTTCILWWLWKARNLWLFERSWLQEKIIVDYTCSDWLEFSNLVC